MKYSLIVLALLVMGACSDGRPAKVIPPKTGTVAEIGNCDTEKGICVVKLDNSDYSRVRSPVMIGQPFYKCNGETDYHSVNTCR